MSSKRRIRRRSCKSKVRHATVEAGQHAIRQLNRARGYQGRLDVYRCQFCGGFHVGHSKRVVDGT